MYSFNNKMYISHILYSGGTVKWRFVIRQFLTKRDDCWPLLKSLQWRRRAGYNYPQQDALMLSPKWEMNRQTDAPKPREERKCVQFTHPRSLLLASIWIIIARAWDADGSSSFIRRLRATTQLRRGLPHYSPSYCSGTWRETTSVLKDMVSIYVSTSLKGNISQIWILNYFTLLNVPVWFWKCLEPYGSTLWSNLLSFF